MGTWNRIVACVAGLAAVTACSVFDPPYRPAALPGASALVIVRGEMIMPLERWGKVFARGATEDVRPLDYGRIAIEGESVQGRALEGALVFNPVRPGRYRVATLGYVQRRSAGPYPVDFPPPSDVVARHPALTFNVRPGEVIVLSKVVIRYRDATMAKDFELASWELVPDPEGEPAALAAVLAQLDPASPWRPTLEAQLRARNR